MKEFENKTVVITGAAKGIGKCIAEEFRREGANVAIIDILPNSYFIGDLSKKEDIESFVRKVIDDFGYVDFIINNAMPLFKGIDECSYEEFCYAQRVGVVAPFYLAKLFKEHMPEGSCIINISSSRDRMSQPQSESYTAAKGGIHSLTHSLAMSLAGKIRVNSISPGWIDTEHKNYEGADSLQHPCKRVGTPYDIAHMVLFLCSDKAGFITGENICIDGGMTKSMIYHGENGWSFNYER